MQCSTERILTTHVGSLARPHDLLEVMREKEHGRPYDPAQTISPETFASLVLYVLEFPADGQIVEVSLRVRS